MKSTSTVVLVAMALAALAGLSPAGKKSTPSLSSLPVVHAQNQNQNSVCSPASLSGPYAFSAQGTLLTSVLGLPAPAPWGEVAVVDFNGSGSLSATVTVNVGGTALNSVPITATYTVNNNCTGTLTIPLDPQHTISEAIVVIRGGQRFVLTHTESFAVVSGSGERLGD